MRPHDVTRPHSTSERDLRFVLEDVVGDELPHTGTAARGYGVELVEVSPTTPPTPVVIMRTFVPFDGGVALIVGGSPATDVQDSVLELFDAVTATFRLQIDQPRS